jgi:hypothetical protein
MKAGAGGSRLVLRRQKSGLQLEASLSQIVLKTLSIKNCQKGLAK